MRAGFPGRFAGFRCIRAAVRRWWREPADGEGGGVGTWQRSPRSELAMSIPAADPAPGLKLLRFGVRLLRVSASTVAVVALLRQQWIAGALFALAWLLILGAPLVFPQLEPVPSADADAGTPDR